MCVLSTHRKMHGDGYNLKIKIHFYVYYRAGYIYISIEFKKVQHIQFNALLFLRHFSFNLKAGGHVI